MSNSPFNLLLNCCFIFRCPLYSDTNNLHEQAVLQGAEAAKKEIGVDKNPSKLKIDPTADVTQHYNEIKKKNPVMVPPYENPGPHVINLQDIPNPLIFNQRAEVSLILYLVLILIGKTWI